MNTTTTQPLYYKGSTLQYALLALTLLLHLTLLQARASKATPIRSLPTTLTLVFGPPPTHSHTSTTKHWSLTDHSLIGMLKVDDKVYRFLGNPDKVFNTLVPAGDEAPVEAAYTTTLPNENWTKATFDDTPWAKGIMPFGSNKNIAKTPWNTQDIWVRRKMTITNEKAENLYFKLNHDDDIEIYLNEHLVYEAKGYTRKYVYVPLNGIAKKHLLKGQNILAVHVRNLRGGSLLDVGIVQEKVAKWKQEVLLATQKNVTINATQTAYTFTCGKVDLALTFTSPLLINELDILARPVSYINTQIKSNDGGTHTVSVYLGASTNIANTNATQEITASQYQANGLEILKAGTTEQPILQKKGDDLRIDWGYMYIGVEKNSKATQSISSGLEDVFNPIQNKKLMGQNLMLNTVIDAGQVGTTAKEQLFLLGYDDIHPIQYFGTNLKPWWNQQGERTSSSSER
ncbi:MAG: DUF5127 domain-containing protein [Spirosomataceae bacterium]